MRKPFAAGFLALILAPEAGAQGITEEDFLAAFGEEHAAVRALTEDLGRAEASRVRAGAFANPRLEFWREDPGSNPRLTNWTLAWTPPLDGRYRLGVKAADAEVAAARERRAVDRAGIRCEARRVFAEWSLALERRDLLRRQVDLVARLSEHEQQRARVGETSGLAARRLTLAAGEVRMALGIAEADYVMAGARARAWRPDLPAGAAPARITLPDPSSSDAGDPPELRALEEEVVRAGLEARRAGRFWSFPTLQFGWQTLEDGGGTEEGPILAAGWTVPLFDRDRGARLEAARREEAAAARLRVARTRVAGAIEGGGAAYRALHDSARGAQEIAREAEPVIEAATRAYRAGEAGLTDLLETLRAAFAATLREIDARGLALEAHRDLEAVLGRSVTGGGSR